MSLPFPDRRAAGERLAAALERHAGRSGLLVLALPRGGVPVGLEVARRLGAALDVLVVRKLGLPGEEELAMGAIASGGVRVLNPDVVGDLHVPEEVIEAVARREQAELERRERTYRGARPAEDPAGRPVILVDDGLATGATMRAAIAALRRRAPALLAVAVPVAPASTCAELAPLADELVCLATPDPFAGVGAWYLDFAPVTDAEVRRGLEAAARQAPAA